MNTPIKTFKKLLKTHKSFESTLVAYMKQYGAVNDYLLREFRKIAGETA